MVLEDARRIATDVLDVSRWSDLEGMRTSAAPSRLDLSSRHRKNSASLLRRPSPIPRGLSLPHRRLSDFFALMAQHWMPACHPDRAASRMPAFEGRNPLGQEVFNILLDVDKHASAKSSLARSGPR